MCDSPTYLHSWHPQVVSKRKVIIKTHLKKIVKIATVAIKHRKLNKRPEFWPLVPFESFWIFLRIDRDSAVEFVLSPLSINWNNA